MRVHVGSNRFMVLPPRLKPPPLCRPFLIEMTRSGELLRSGVKSPLDYKPFTGDEEGAQCSPFCQYDDIVTAVNHWLEVQNADFCYGSVCALDLSITLCMFAYYRHRLKCKLKIKKIILKYKLFHGVMLSVSAV